MPCTHAHFYPPMDGTFRRPRLIMRHGRWIAIYARTPDITYSVFLALTALRWTNERNKVLDR